MVEYSGRRDRAAGHFGDGNERKVRCFCLRRAHYVSSRLPPEAHERNGRAQEPAHVLAVVFCGVFYPRKPAACVQRDEDDFSLVGLLGDAALSLNHAAFLAECAAGCAEVRLQLNGDAFSASRAKWLRHDCREVIPIAPALHQLGRKAGGLMRLRPH